MKKTQLVIIGSGPAAYTAAIYAARANIFPIVFEGFMSGIVGGQLMTTTDIENFPGFPEGILGAQLMDRMKKQAIRFQTITLMEDVVSVQLDKYPFVVSGNKTRVETNAIIVATGATARKLNIPGAREGELWQKGVTACAVCDGAAPIFKNKNLFVVGGGDSAVEEALFLTKYGKKVFIVHRRDQLRASKIMVKRAIEHPKIEVLWDSEVIEVKGSAIVEEVVIQNNRSNEIVSHKAGGLFFAIGHVPNVKFLNGQLELLDNGYIKTKEGSMQTSVEGVFAAGDVQDPHYRQAITAAGSGCMAALDVERWLSYKGLLDL
ncbi:MAG TPA: thioredoxin-disulfide reductase [Chlamydiales bacterium]|nr:thioredoxin-disulfide reductase [Chlamydiales bacterium]